MIVASPESPRWLHWKSWPAAFLAMVLAIVSCVASWREAREQACFDYYQAWMAAAALYEGNPASVYTDEGRRVLGIEFDRRAGEYAPDPEHSDSKVRRGFLAGMAEDLRTTGTPWQYAFQGFWASEHYGRDQDRWQLVSLLSLAFAVVVFGVALCFPWTAIGLAVAAAAQALPVQSDLWVGNVARFQVGSMALVVLLSHSRGLPWRQLWAGLLLGSTVVFKPNLAPMALMLCMGWMASRSVAAIGQGVAGAAAGAALGVLVSTLAFGQDVWASWFDQLLGIGRGTSMRTGNVASVTLGSSMGGGLWGAALGGTVAAALVLGVLLWWRRRVGTPDASTCARVDVLMLGLGGAASTLTSPLVWVHYFVLIIPLALFAVRPGVGGDFLRGAGFLGVALAVQWPNEWPVKVFPAPQDPMAATMITVGTVILVVVAVVSFVRSSASRS